MSDDQPKTEFRETIDGIIEKYGKPHDTKQCPSDAIDHPAHDWLSIAHPAPIVYTCPGVKVMSYDAVRVEALLQFITSSDLGLAWQTYLNWVTQEPCGICKAQDNHLGVPHSKAMGDNKTRADA